MIDARVLIDEVGLQPQSTINGEWQMFQGQYLFKDESIFGPWMGRQGDNIIVTGDLLAQASANLDIELYHKNQEDTGDGSAVDANKITLSTVGSRGDHEWNGLKELVRYKFTSTGDSRSLRPLSNARPGVVRLGRHNRLMGEPFMFEAQYLHDGNEVFSDWHPRLGDYVRLTADLISKENADLEISVYSKNSEDPGDGTAVPLQTRLTVTSEGRDTAEWTSLEELVRFRLVCQEIGGAADYVLFRALDLVWFDAVETI